MLEYYTMLIDSPKHIFGFAAQYTEASLPAKVPLNAWDRAELREEKVVYDNLMRRS